MPDFFDKLLEGTHELRVFDIGMHRNTNDPEMGFRMLYSDERPRRVRAGRLFDLAGEAFLPRFEIALQRFSVFHPIDPFDRDESLPKSGIVVGLEPVKDRLSL